jgi:predicted ATPase/DNA-binding XRE family transcriptional regulator
MDGSAEHPVQEEILSFGAWLRRAREQAGLTQDELAERAGLSTNAISALERGDRRRPYPATVRALGAALGLSPTDYAAVIATLPRRPPPGSRHVPERLDYPEHPVPLSPLIGRDREVASVRALLSQPEVRIVTLTGSGGVGKSRLALAVAEASASDFADGVRFIGLAAIRNPGLVLPAIARQLKIHEPGPEALIERLTQTLRPRHLLLVIDNMEQVIDAATSLADLLMICPQLTILVTSRVVLRLSGERDVLVQPLALPGAGIERTPESLIGFPSVRLFVERAQARDGGFVLTPGNAADIAAICWRLDGVPLAIELAAAWSHVLAPAALLSRLEQRLPLLVCGPRDAPARHRTMRDAIAWSYDLLGPHDQAHFRRLSVFTDGFSLEAAEALGAMNGEPAAAVVAGLSALTDASLVHRLDARRSDRLAMLETIREYGVERLIESGEEAATRDAHASYMVGLAQRSAQEWIGNKGGDWLARLSDELENVRAALDWLWETGQITVGLRLASELIWFWDEGTHWREGRDWLERFLSQDVASPPGLRSTALNSAGWLMGRLGELDRADAFAQEGLSIGREHGLGLEPEGLYSVLAGMLASQRGDHLVAMAHFEDMLRTTRALQLEWGICGALGNLGLTAVALGDLAAARTWYEEALVLQREHMFWLPFAHVLAELSLVLLKLGDSDAASQRVAEYLDLVRELDIDPALDALAQFAIAREQWACAAQLIGREFHLAASQERDPFCGDADLATDGALFSAVKERMGDRQFAVALEEGRLLSRQQTLSVATVLVGMVNGTS